MDIVTSKQTTWYCADCSYQTQDAKCAEAHELNNSHTTHPTNMYLTF